MNPQSLNRYSYVQNDPVNFVDPSGLNMIGGGACFGTQYDYYLYKDGKLVGEAHWFEASYCINYGSGGDGRGAGDWIGGGGPQNPTPSPSDFRRDLYNTFQADINRCIGTIFGSTAKKIPTQTFANSPRLNATKSGIALAKKADTSRLAPGNYKAVGGIPDPNLGPHGTVFIASEEYSNPSFPLDILQGEYIHELGNILAKKYGGDYYKFGSKTGIGQAKDKDTGANFQNCVFPSSIHY